MSGGEKSADGLEAQRLHDQGKLAEDAGDERAALRLFREAVDASVRADDVDRELHNRYHVASILSGAHRYTEALAALGPGLRDRDLSRARQSTLESLVGSVIEYFVIVMSRPVALAHIREAIDLMQRLYRSSSTGSFDGWTGEDMLDWMTYHVHKIRDDESSALHLALALRRRERSITSLDIAQLYLSMDRVEDAENLVEEASFAGETFSENSLSRFRFSLARKKGELPAAFAIARDIWEANRFGKPGDRRAAAEAMAQVVMATRGAREARSWVAQAAGGRRSESAFYRHRAYVLLGDYHLAHAREAGGLPPCDIQHARLDKYTRLPCPGLESARHLDAAELAYNRAAREAEYIDRCLENRARMDQLDKRWQRWRALSGQELARGRLHATTA